MNELESGAKALIDAARKDEPPTADRDRIKHLIVLQVAAVGAVASAGTGAAVAGTMSLGAKLGVAVLAASLVGGGAIGVMKLRGTHQAAPATQPPVVQRAPAVHKAEPAAAELGPVEVPESAAVPQAESKTRKADRARKPPEPAATEGVPEDPLNTEVAVLKRAREALQLGRPAQALRALAEYDQLFGKGALGEERQAMAAIALCQVQPGAKAREQAAAFIRSAPNSPLCERVRATCITPPLKNRP
jgi:hypothetical protein